MISYNLELNDWKAVILQIWDNFYVISLQVLAKKKYNTRMVYQGSRSPPRSPYHSDPKGNNKFKSYM